MCRLYNNFLQLRAADSLPAVHGKPCQPCLTCKIPQSCATVPPVCRRLAPTHMRIANRLLVSGEPFVVEVYNANGGGAWNTLVLQAGLLHRIALALCVDVLVKAPDTGMHGFMLPTQLGHYPVGDEQM